MDGAQTLPPPPPYSPVDAGASSISPPLMRFPEPTLNGWNSPYTSSPVLGEACSSSTGAPGGGTTDPAVMTRIPKSNGRANWTTFNCSKYSGDDFIVRDSDDKILYWVENTHEHMFRANPIRVFKPGKGGGGKVLFAVMTINRIDPKTLELPMEGKKNIRMDTLFKPKPWPSYSRLWSTASGEWKWAYDDKDPQLFDEDRKLILKYTNNLRVRYGPAPPTVSVHPKCLKDLDSVMLGLILDLNDIELRKRC